jgi:hypothetical protein
MNRALAVLLALVGPATALGQTLACQPTDGIYVPPGASAFSEAVLRDPKVLTSKFFVELSTSTVVGNALHSTQGMKREVVRNDEKGLELVLRTSLGDTVVLKIARDSDRWTFTQYHSWVNLFLVGKCEPQ